MKSSQSAVHDIMSQRVFALVGASRSGKKFGNAILRDLKAKGLKVFPVHPQAESIEGERCYPDFKSLPEKPGAVIVCVPPTQTEKVVKETFEAGITRVWLQQGAVSDAALKFCESHEVTTVHGQCILMFAEPVQSIHGFHRWIWKLIGKYPASTPHHTSPH
jgi:uncharacterized protein